MEFQVKNCGLKSLHSFAQATNNARPGGESTDALKTLGMSVGMGVVCTCIYLFVELVLPRWVQDRNAHPPVRVHCGRRSQKKQAKKKKTKPLRRTVRLRGGQKINISL